MLGNNENNSRLSSVCSKNIENEIRIYWPQIHQSFVKLWFKNHNNFCNNHKECKSFRKLFYYF